MRGKLVLFRLIYLILLSILALGTSPSPYTYPGSYSSRGLHLYTPHGPFARYFLQEEFTTADDNPLTSPRNCEPGPGIITFRDVEGKMAIADGWLEFTPQATAVYAEQDLVSPAITRAAGVALFGKFRCTTDGSFYPLALVTSATPTWNATHVEAAFHRAATALSLTATYNATAGPIIATFVADGTLYKTALIADGAAGYKYLIKGGAFTNWTLLFRSATGGTATLYAAMAGYNAAFGADFARAVQTAVSNPLLSDTFSGTFGLPDVIGGIWNGFTWASAGGVVGNLPVEGVELVVNGDFASSVGWTLAGSATIGSGVLTISNAVAGEVFARRGSHVAYACYKASITINSITEGGVNLVNGSSVYVGPLMQAPGTFVATYINTSGTIGYSIFSRSGVEMSGEIDNFSTKILPISTLITNQVLSTTDVLAEMVISAYTLYSQAGIVQSDRPFAFKANANAAAGQTAIVLKGLTHAVPDTDTLTIKHPIAGGTIYTIASVGAMAGGIQTITLDVNLVEAVSADDWVGVDWASWNGTRHYFDGEGKLKIDEILAGIPTNRLSASKAFSAGARLMVRKLVSEYGLFYGEALIGTTSAIAAGAMTGLYWGMIVTDPATTITSFRVDDTGNVSGWWNFLNRYTFDDLSFLKQQIAPDSYWMPEVANG